MSDVREPTDEEVEVAVSASFDLMHRRIYLGRNMPKCPECSHEQVQLVRYDVAPARWKCRICNHRFMYEPPVDDIITVHSKGQRIPFPALRLMVIMIIAWSMGYASGYLSAYFN